jgi:hypothetical protein
MDRTRLGRTGIITPMAITSIRAVAKIKPMPACLGARGETGLVKGLLLMAV